MSAKHYHVTCSPFSTQGIKAAFEKAGAQDVTAESNPYLGGVVNGTLTDEGLASLRKDLKAQNVTIIEGKGKLSPGRCY